jgi:hypothetical protein
VKLIQIFIFLFSCAITLSADNFKEQQKNSILRLTVTFQTASHYYPWRHNAPSSRSGQGLVIGKNRILTLATLVYQARLVEARLNAEPSPIVLKIIYTDLDRNIAVLEGDLPSEAQIIDIPQTSGFKASQKIQYFWKTDTGRFLEGSATFDQAESYRLSPSFQSQIWYSCSNPTTGGGYGEPVYYDKKLVGIAVYGDESRISILQNETIHKSLNILKDKKNLTSMMGFVTSPCTQKYLRMENNLKPTDGGCYVNKTFGQGCGSKTIKKGDILLKIGDHKLDAWGRYNHPRYENINFTHLIGNYTFGEKIIATLMREGKLQTVELDPGIIDDSKWLIPRNRIGKQSKYFITGGFIFQKLSIPYLKAWGSSWESKAPENILTILGENRFKLRSEEKQDIVVLSHILAHPINRAIQYIGRQVITSVNGNPLKGLKELHEIFARNDEKLTLTLSPGDVPVIISPKALNQTNDKIQEMYHIPNLENL